MDVIGDTLSTLRRIHLVLFLVAAAVLVAAVPRGEDHGAAIRQLDTARSLFESRAITVLCGSEARKHIQAWWSQVESRLGEDVEFDERPDIWLHYWCDIPGVGRSLEAQAAYFDAATIVLLLPDADSTASAVRALERPQALRRVSLQVPREAQSRGTSSDEAVAVLREAAELLTLRFMVGPDTGGPESGVVDVALTVRVERKRWLPGVHLRRSGPERFAGLVGLSLEGDEIFLPDVRPFWNEVRTMSNDEAVRYLQGLAREGAGSVEVFGLGIDTGVLGWAGPPVMVLLLAHLLLHLRHLGRIAPAEESLVHRYPWIPLFPGRGARFGTFLSLLLIPVASVGFVAYRVRDVSPTVTAWAVGMGIVVVVLGIQVLRELQGFIRQTG